MKNDAATLGQAQKVLGLIEQKGLSGDQIQALLESGLLADLFEAGPGGVQRTEFRKALGFPEESRSGLFLDDHYWIRVDYRRSPLAMFSARNWVLPTDMFRLLDVACHRTDMFFVAGNPSDDGEKEVRLALFRVSRGDSKSPGDVSGLLEIDNFVPIAVGELLSLGAQFPSLHSIVSLAKPWDTESGRAYPFIRREGGEKERGVGFFKEDWKLDHSYLIPAVSKYSLT